MSNFGHNMDGFALKRDYPTSFDGVASNMESPYEAKALSSNARASSSRSRCSRFTDLVLRILAVVLSVIAFATMVSDSKSALLSDEAGNVFILKLKYSYSDSTKAVLAANALVCAYSLAQTLGALISIIAGHSLLSTPISEYISFILDQIFAYLVVATSASGATLVNLINNGGGDLWPSLCKGTGLSGFCTLAAASVSISFLTFVVLAISAVQSGYFLAKHITES
ncbi:hypothetical protein O6H91_05G051900 [Diphasiastrum complanatum]|uniref:Uncharacterized protein n=1 Tax=Diphasiastrum complanatum TaxID=34168 RepID=A0ACC2DNA6_DIPCM|nr:hypothetical protein O6H91_Y008000 [Diphasiastrum complanatum]KAJ7555709.1 hypothetical protein O6H91_05G051900 [Diphasiastrum complanatum]